MATQYVPPVGPGSGGPGTSAAGGASPDAFGAAVGAGLEGVGQSLTEAATLDKQRQNEQQAADASRNLTELGTQLNGEFATMRENAPAGAPGHAVAVQARTDQALADLRSQYEDAGAAPRVLRMFDENAVQIRNHFVTQAQDWQVGKEQEKQVSDTDQTLNGLSANVRAARGNTDSYVQASHQWNSLVDVSISNGDVREKMRAEGNRAIDRAWVEGLIDKDPALAREALTTPTLQGHDGATMPNPILQPGHLDGKDVEQLLNSVEVEQRRRDAQGKVQEAHDRAAAAAQAGLLHDRFEKGDTPTIDEIRQTAATVARYPGPETDKIVYDLNALGEQVDWREQTKPWTVAQFDATIEQLQAKGDKRTPQQGRELDFMLKERAQRAAQPVEQQMALIGRPPPPLNFADPASFDARKTWAIAAHALHPEKPIPFLASDTEEATVRQMLSDGPQSQLLAIGMLQRFGPAAAGDIIRHVAPGNQALARAAGLPADAATEVLQGPAILNARPGLWDEQQARAINQEVSQGIPPEMQAEVYAAAKGIYGARVAQTSNDGWSEGDYRMALQRAMSARGSGDGMRGGMQTYNGRLTWIPPTMTKSEFETKLARSTAPELVAAAGGHTPYWGDHSMVKLPQFRTLQLVPAQDDSGHYHPGLYYLQSPLGGVLHDKQGRPWRLDVTKLR